MSEYVVDINKKSVQKKIEQVKTTVEEMKNSPTVALIDLRKLPDALLQKVRQKIRQDGGKVKILKKPVIERVLKSDKILVNHVSESEKPLGLIFTPKSPVELYTFFKTNKKRRAAKAGDIAPSEIVVPEGETDLPPGPALSELKAAGINVQIKGGKIAVVKDSVVAKEGDKITMQKAKALQTLGVLPFEVYVNYILGYDGKYVYQSDIFAITETLDIDLQASLFDAFNVSVNAAYPTEANADALLSGAVNQSMNMAINGDIYSSISIEQLLSSAFRQGMALSGLEGTAPPPKEEKPEEKAPAKAEEGSDAPTDAKPEAEAEKPKESKPEEKTEAEKPKESKPQEKTEVKEK